MISKNRPAIFLDRDGVLIHEVHYLSKLESIKIYDDVPKALRELKTAGYLLIMITNQSGVARGYFDEQFVQAAFNKIQASLLKQKVELDAMFYCPHHLSGQTPYNIECDCRKPNPGMIIKATREFNIDLSRSYMIGDKLCDIELAINAGTTGILLKTGHGKAHETKVQTAYPQTQVFEKFQEAAEFIFEDSEKA